MKYQIVGWIRFGFHHVLGGSLRRRLLRSHSVVTGCVQAAGHRCITHGLSPGRLDGLEEPAAANAQSCLSKNNLHSDLANRAETRSRARFVTDQPPHLRAAEFLGADVDDTAIDHPERACRSGAEIEDAAAVERAAIGDDDDDAAAGF